MGGRIGCARAALSLPTSVGRCRRGGLRIKSPSIVQAHQPDGERPVFLSDEHYSLIIAVWNDLMLVPKASRKRLRVAASATGSPDITISSLPGPSTRTTCCSSSVRNPHQRAPQPLRRRYYSAPLRATASVAAVRDAVITAKAASRSAQGTGEGRRAEGSQIMSINRICVRLEHDTDD